MTEKEKGKDNPFEHMLYLDEEILWLEAPRPLTAQQHLAKFLRPVQSSGRFRILVGFSLFCIIYVVNATQDDPVAAFFQVTRWWLLIPLFLVIIAYGLAWIQRNTVPTYKYALTTRQRLMFVTDTTPEWLLVSDIKSLYITGTNRNASITLMVMGSRVYTWDNVGGVEILLSLLRPMRETPIKVMWM